jgi:hypothetical protein
MWAVLLGVMLVLAAATSSHAAMRHARAVAHVRAAAIAHVRRAPAARP